MESATLNQGFEFTAELLDPRDHRHSAGVAEHADGLPGHLIGDVEESVQIFGRSLTIPDALEDLGRPRRTFAALRALRTALVGEEAGDPRDHCHHRRAAVDAYNAARAQNRSLRDKPFLTHERTLCFVQGLIRSRRPAGNPGFKFPAVKRPAAEIVKEF